VTQGSRSGWTPLKPAIPLSKTSPCNVGESKISKLLFAVSIARWAINLLDLAGWLEMVAERLNFSG